MLSHPTFCRQKKKKKEGSLKDKKNFSETEKSSAIYVFSIDDVVCVLQVSLLFCLVRDAFARLEALVPSIVHHRTANIFTDYGPYYHSWYQADFNRTHALCKSLFL